MLKKLFLLSTLLLGLLTVQGQDTFISENFDSETEWSFDGTPADWELDGFDHEPSSGVDNSNCIAGSLKAYAGRGASFIAPAFNFGSHPKVEFYYKTYSFDSYGPIENSLELTVSVAVSDNDWVDVGFIHAADYVASDDYAIAEFDLASYANQTGRIKISAKTAPAITEEIIIYVDNFRAGTQASGTDLSINALSGKTYLNLNEKTTYSVTVTNNGAQEESDYTVELYHKNGGLIVSANGTTLQKDKKATLELTYTPQTAGLDTLYAKVSCEGDGQPDNDTSAYFPINVLGKGVSVSLGQPGNGESIFTPLGFEYAYYASQALYTFSDVNYQLGYINTMVYEGKFAENLKSNVTIWVGEVTLPNLFQQSVSPEFLTKVFEGEVTFPAGERQSVAIPLQKNYQYKGGSLLVYVYAHNETAYGLGSQKGSFYHEEVSTGPVLIWSAFNDNALDPQNPASMDDLRSHGNGRPNLTLLMDQEPSEKTYTLTFDVKDEKGKAITDAVVTLNGSNYPAGQYVFEDLASGGYNWSVSKANYSSQSGKTGIINSNVSENVVLRSLEGIPYISDYFIENFDAVGSGSRPAGWEGNFYVEDGNGVDGSKHLTHSFWFMDGARYITTHPVFMGENPTFEFSYRVMDRTTYPQNEFKGENMSYTVKVSTDLGKTWSDLYAEDYGQHVASKDYKTLTVDVSPYANEICMFELEVNRDYDKASDEFYFDIDNWKIGTPSERDLCMAAPINGARITSSGKETAYQVVVRNTGKTDYASYTVKLMLDGTEIGSAAGSSLKTGATAVHEIRYTPGETGDFTLTAQLQADGDMVAFNNVSNPFHLSVVAENISASTFGFYEGNDLGYVAPYNLHTPYSLNYTLYPKEYMQIPTDEAICGLAYKTRFSSPVERKKVTIYLTETDSDHVSTNDLIPVKDMQKVYEGVLNFSDTDQDNLIINFSVPYQYQGKNLVVCAYKESETGEPWESDCYFYGKYMLGTIRSYTVTSETAINLDNFADIMGSPVMTNPSTVFLSRGDIASYTVNFEVTDQNDQPVKNAIVTFNGKTMAAGEYTITDVFDGTYAYSVRLGKAEASGSVTVNGADVTEKVKIELVGNEFNLTNDMIRIYPNPTTDKLHIDVAEGAKEINLYDISGRTVRKLNRVPAGIIEMDLSECHSGIYLLMIDGQAFKISKR